MSSLAIAQLLANGGRVDDVAAAFGAARKAVMDAGFDHGMRYLGGKDTFAMTDKAATMLRAAGTPTPAVLPTPPQQQRSVVTVGLTCPDPKVRRAAEKARDAVERLRDLLAEWEDQAAARAEVDRLEAELAAAKARLRGSTATPDAPAEAGPDSREVRAWAAANGVPCPARGRVPGSVRDAYESAREAS